MSVTYTSYLKLDQILEAQKPLSDPPEHDETLFIIIHQVYELWFKQINHELRFLQKKMLEADLPSVFKTFRRTLTILKTMVSQIDILETMTPLSFRTFRDRLETSSGFQSFQFREFEFLLGKRSHMREAQIPATPKERTNSDSIYDSFLLLLHKKGLPISEATLKRDRSKSHEPNLEVQHALIQVYKEHPGLSQICEYFVDLDEGIQEWRYRHVKMVERTIGSKQGTGGSGGVSYLKSTLFQPIFPDVWNIRDQF